MFEEMFALIVCI